jgi:glucose-fructose oxidoreductase
MAKWKVAGINFDHMHMGDQLRCVLETPEAELVGVADHQTGRMEPVADRLGIPRDRCFADYQQCLEQTQPDLIVLCPSTATHGQWLKRVAPYNAHVMVEKPFAASLAEADDMIAAMQATGKQLAIHWPMMWYRPHRTAKRLIDEGYIGAVQEVHYYDGNRGPLYHTMDKIEVSEEEFHRTKQSSWFYQAEAGGGAMLDYLGYGTTLGTWFNGGRKPSHVTAVNDQPNDLEVDEHAIVIAQYDTGLSKFETRWGTFTDPWTHQPQPKCGFVMVGTEGTVSCYDFEPIVWLQTRANPAGEEVPVDELQPPHQGPIQHMLHCLETGQTPEGPLSPAVSRIGQQIVDSAQKSIREQRTVELIDR